MATEQVELCRIVVPRDLAERLQALADKMGASQAWLRRRALIEFLDRQEG